MSDYEIDQIRQLRHQVSADHGHDLRKLAEYYRQIERELRASGKFRFAGPDTAEEESRSTPAAQ